MTHSNRSRFAVSLGDGWRIYWGVMPLPAGASALGTITRAGGDVGALLRTAVGAYAQGNAGVLRTLDQRKTEAAVALATGTSDRRVAAPAFGFAKLQTAAEETFAREPLRGTSGGARSGAGRPTADGASGMTRKNVTLDQSSIDVLRAVGDGDLSLGIRRAAARIPQ